MLTISMGFRSELIVDRGKEVVSTNRNYVYPELSYMRYITPFDALINKVTLSIGQRCIEMIKPGVCKPTYEPIAPIAQQLEPFQMKNLPNPTNFDEPYKKATTKLFTMFDSKELAAKFADGTTLKLDGIHHGIVHDSLFETEDFLMTYKARHAGVGSLRQLMKRFQMRSYYGPGTLKVLESIGWPLRKSPKTLKLIKSENGKDLLIGSSTFKSV